MSKSILVLKVALVLDNDYLTYKNMFEDDVVSFEEYVKMSEDNKEDYLLELPLETLVRKASISNVSQLELERV